ncbi:MAG: HD domain-containing protein [Sedimentisphaerales bacterium]|nr:HD domain-containing protein [Sedimentisphaerales bacterium]
MSKYRRSDKELYPNPHAAVNTKGRKERQDFDDFRTEFQRDVHRIIYSQSFRRLRYKTQVFYFPQNDHVSTRMDHVRFVASAARTVARSLRLNEDLAEAIGLAHDIGHAPFGHQGEDFFNEIINSHLELKACMPKFSHEIYGLRVVDYIAKRDREKPGLNLTWEVRDGIVSHCGEDFKTCKLLMGDKNKNLDNIKTREDADLPATLEGCIVRLIDKIAYAGKDVEDAIEVDIIKEKDIPSKFKKRLGKTNGMIIGTFIEDIIKNSFEKNYIELSLEFGNLLHELIQFNIEHIYHRPKAEEYKEQAGKTIKFLFEDLLSEIKRTNRFESDRYSDPQKNGSIPRVYRIFQNFITEDMKDVYTQNDPDELIVLDFIAGMTDIFAIRSLSDIFIPRISV